MSSARSALEAFHYHCEFRIAMLDRLRVRVFERFFGRNSRQPAPMRQLLVIGELQAHDQGDTFVNLLLWLFRWLIGVFRSGLLAVFAGLFFGGLAGRFLGRITAGFAGVWLRVRGRSVFGLFDGIPKFLAFKFRHHFLVEAEGLLPAVDGAPRLLRRFLIRAEIENQIRLRHAIGISAAYIGVKSPPAFAAQQSGTSLPGAEVLAGTELTPAEPWARMAIISFLMARRLISLLALFALLATLVAGPVASLAAKMPDCCNGPICPMHHKAGGCDTDTNQVAPMLQSCPTHDLQYTASLVFVCITPLALCAELTTEPAAVFAPAKAVRLAAVVDPPPPRLIA